MNENNKYYFSIIKLCSIIILMMYYIYSSQESLHEISMEWFLLAVLLISAIGFELVGRNKKDVIDESRDKTSRIFHLFQNVTDIKRLVFLSMEILLTVILILFNTKGQNGVILFPMVALDTIIFLNAPFYYSVLIFTGAFLKPQNIQLYLIYCCFLLIIYFQNYMVIEKYRKNVDDFEKEEYKLKDSIHEKDTQYKEELEKSSLSYENRMLEEKARLSQALHDKLGHSINGSIYQLEACKVLLEKEPEESIKIVQGVIDNLRTSMDEIRSILRREKPSKKQTALLQLQGLCEECKEKYGITADVKLNGENKEISELIWDVILDNTIEAVTNALKYANCTKIVIEIVILHKIIRCSISDNGNGCNSIEEGMGIQGMKNRTRKVNGFIDISSDNGFRINMIIPIE